MEAENKNRELKHLGFMRMAAIQAVVCVSNLYDFTKQNSGPLKSMAGSVERAVTTVATPAYNKLKDVSDDLLVFVDKKVDEASHKFDEHAPTVAKKMVSQANTIIQKASEKAQRVVKEARTGGPRAAFNYAATEYKQFLMTNSVKVWIILNKYKPIHIVAEKALQPARQVSEKYNHLVENMTQKGYPMVGYLPLVPVDEIAITYDKENEAVKKPDEISVYDKENEAVKKPDEIPVYDKENEAVKKPDEIPVYDKENEAVNKPDENGNASSSDSDSDSHKE